MVFEPWRLFNLAAAINEHFATEKNRFTPATLHGPFHFLMCAESHQRITPTFATHDFLNFLRVLENHH